MRTGICIAGLAGIQLCHRRGLRCDRRQSDSISRAPPRFTVDSESAQPAGPWRRSSDRSEEHTSELHSLMRISYAVFCLKKKNNTTKRINTAIDIIIRIPDIEEN